MILLEDVYKKVVTFLNRGKYKYLIIGGVAAGTLGEPRITADVDVDIIIDKKSIPDFLDKATYAGFSVLKEKCLVSARRTGVFQINLEDFHVDFIIASTDLETTAFERAKTIKLYGIKAFFPSPEDLILLKIIPGRDKDLLDAKSVVLRHKGKLDTRYLKTWATKLCDEAEDMRIWKVLNNLLKD
jgi:predicted nucleotidyltransferase